MDADERMVYTYLKSWPGQFVAGREICRRAGGKRRFRLEPEWALPVLNRLVELKLVEADSTGHYRLIPRDKTKRRKWVSPQMKKILESSGKDFSQVMEIDEDDL